MTQKEREELEALCARLEDLCGRAEHGEMAYSAFLSPKECHYACAYLRRAGAKFEAFGGYEEAERRRLYLLPDYMELSEETDSFEALLASFGMDTEIRALRIEGSGYRHLTHRDFLGSLLGLGLERDVIGDLVVDSESGKWAIVLCDRAIALFLEQELKKVANDKVRVTPVEEWQMPARRFAPIHDTVASARLDCVVAALCGLSREKARDAVCGGFVEIDFESEERPDRLVDSVKLISVRGYGRFRILSLRDLTRKGRIRLEAEKYL